MVCRCPQSNTNLPQSSRRLSWKGKCEGPRRANEKKSRVAYGLNFGIFCRVIEAQLRRWFLPYRGGAGAWDSCPPSVDGVLMVSRTCFMVLVSTELAHLLFISVAESVFTDPQNQQTWGRTRRMGGSRRKRCKLFVVSMYTHISANANTHISTVTTDSYLSLSHTHMRNEFFFVLNKKTLKPWSNQQATALIFDLVSAVMMAE